MPRTLPDNRHDCVLWLFERLENVVESGLATWRGRLPEKYSFEQIVEELFALGGAPLAPGTDSETRIIEFNPWWGHVYSSLDELLIVHKNQRSAPPKFTIRDLEYVHGASDAVPAPVARYLAAVKLCNSLLALSDHESRGGEVVHFIHRHDRKLSVYLTYDRRDLADLPELDDFVSEYVDSRLHADQKRNIFRSSLLDVFGGLSSVSAGDVISKFGELFGFVRDSYSMYAADFSVERMRRELEKLNLDDTLRLNKTLSEIQNQLLALPAALILAGASISPENPLRTIATLLGIVVFTCLMLTLVGNQGNSVDAITKEISLREVDLSSQPATIAQRYLPAVAELKVRAKRQRLILRGISIAVFVVFVSVVALAVLSMTVAP